ncbi:MAG: hypothetical protein ACK55I_16205, partial [bacterium]
LDLFAGDLLPDELRHVGQGGAAEEAIVVEAVLVFDRFTHRPDLVGDGAGLEDIGGEVGAGGEFVGRAFPDADSVDLDLVTAFRQAGGVELVLGHACEKRRPCTDAGRVVGDD